jgi:hypothetical protein
MPWTNREFPVPVISLVTMDPQPICEHCHEIFGHHCRLDRSYEGSLYPLCEEEYMEARDRIETAKLKSEDPLENS